MCVVDLEVDLRPVKRGLSDSDPVLLAHRVERLGEGGLRLLPLLFGPEPLVLHIVASRKLIPELIDAENPGEVEGQVDRTLHLVHQLVGRAEDVRVVQRE